MNEHIERIKAAIAVIKHELAAIDELDPEAGWFIENEVDVTVCELDDAIEHLEKTWST